MKIFKKPESTVCKGRKRMIVLFGKKEEVLTGIEPRTSSIAAAPKHLDIGNCNIIIMKNKKGMPFLFLMVYPRIPSNFI